MASSQTDFEIRKALSCSEIHKMKSIWNFKIENSLKIITFKATIELYYYMIANVRQSIQQCVNK